MPPADPAAVPPPEWARKMVLAYYGLPPDALVEGFDVDALATLLATLRESALREAVVEIRKFCGGYYADFVEAKILALIAQPPKEQA